MLNRREFNALAVAARSSLHTVSATIAMLSGTPALSDAAGTTSDRLRHTVKFKNGPVVAAIGQGSARLGQGRHPEAAEEKALRTGLSLGMTVIDTAEIYSGGNAER